VPRRIGLPALLLGLAVERGVSCSLHGQWLQLAGASVGISLVIQSVGRIAFGIQEKSVMPQQHLGHRRLTLAGALAKLRLLASSTLNTLVPTGDVREGVSLLIGERARP
jgi:branched-subunit amino acid ABC-type transport system permease component